jgi:nucleoid-associated protein YgaU
MLNKNWALIALVIFTAGCGFQVRSYVMTKDRVGLDRGTGNGGCITGKCPPTTSAETTRKVYVLEFTKPVSESEVQKIEETAVSTIMDTQTQPASSIPAAATPAADNAQPAAPAPVHVPVVGELPGSDVTPSAPETAAPAATPAANGGNLQEQTYVVQKDDTLQKIAKKVYGSYGKWYKIYEANKSKIKNPNILKTGTVLTIPTLK